ncbi:MAG: hypothetical protein AYK23_04535 [Candidatus Proteinoplasmatales archaeon SG8-5]|nr:MAG: hypothetical protein AYK23_04535 [Candidatus Proteinoplasmatales archaeon SG8-5]
MDYLFLISGIVGFGPALFLIWFSMRKYSYPYIEGSAFEDRRVFFLLAVGMVFGTALVWLERFFYEYFAWTDADNNFNFDLGMFIVVFVLAFVIMESLAKFIVLNWKTYQGRFDSVFYGISFSAGFAATAMIGHIYWAVSLSDTASDPMWWVSIVLFSVSLSLMHTTVGANIGYASIKLQGLGGLPMAIMPHIIFNLLMYIWFVQSPWIFLALALPITAYFFRGVYLYTIPEVLPEEIKKEIRRKSRGDRR